MTADTDLRSRRVVVMLTPTEERELRDIAQSRDESMSDVIRKELHSRFRIERYYRRGKNKKEQGT